MARSTEWATKVMGLVRGGNTPAAIAQIRVAPSVRDLQSLQAALLAANLTGRWRDLDTAVADNLVALSAPRLHRSP